MAGLRDPKSISGRRDESNQAASFCMSELLLQGRPRYSTTEQTSGILEIRRHVDIFRALICQYTALGFGVSWRSLELVDFGNSHQCKRVITTAACPGSVMPPWLKPTHGPGRTFPYGTVEDYIAHINLSHSHHHPIMRRQSGQVCSRNRPLPRLISTQGSSVLHPDGRAFTIRELAALMTLPLDFQFPRRAKETILKRQIGNMVPLCFTDMLMRTIRATIREERLQHLT